MAKPDLNEMTTYYLGVPLRISQFPTPGDDGLLVRTARHAALLMAYLDTFGADILPHIMDNDDNPGEYLRQDLRRLGLWE